MAIAANFLAFKLKQGGGKLGAGAGGPKVKRGDEILAGPYPKQFSDFIGQTSARSHVLMSISAALKQGRQMDHMLIGSGDAGVGKTAFGRLTAHKLGAGVVELSGIVTDEDAVRAIKVMQDGDVLMLDEIHRLVNAGKGKAEWLLTLLQDGELHTPSGAVKAPKITVIAMTTDKERLPRTILDRFKLQPIFKPYTAYEGAQIALVQAKSLGFGSEHLPLPESGVWLEAVARAAKGNPRRMASLLSTVRDIAVATDLANLGETGYSLEMALSLTGLTEDGLTQSCQDYLVGLFAHGGTASLPTIKGLLNEEVLTHTERDLFQAGYVEITGRGRRLTEYGTERAVELAEALAGAM